MPFLPNHDPRVLTTPAPPSWTPEGLFVGQGPMALQVAVYRANARPATRELRDTLQARAGNGSAPVLLLVLHGERGTALAHANNTEHGPLEVTASQLERLADALLQEPSRHAASARITTALSELAGHLPGVINQGLFSTHDLISGVTVRPEWVQANENAGRALGQRGRPLIAALGFDEEALPGPASVLLAHGTKQATAVFLERRDEVDSSSARYDGLSPVSYALAKADAENVDYVIVTAGSMLRLYPAKPGVGVGRRARTETYIEFNVDLMDPARAGHLWLIASADALRPGGTFERLLQQSADYASDLGSRLRERVYSEVVPGLAQAIVQARRLRRPSPAKLQETYDAALLVLFRLLFVAYAEDTGRLPLHTNREYERHSLKAVAKRLLEMQRTGTPFEDGDFLWTELSQLWKAIDRGHRAWGVPAYNGGLFASEAEAYPGAAVLADLSLTDRVLGPVLVSLLLDTTPEGDTGPVDFRSLGVREFGTIYEGLLESNLAIAPADLTTDRRGVYAPAGERDPIVVAEGSVYLHNTSGARKATGAYYTKSFAVEHLLDAALEPALKDHLARLDALDDVHAGERLFDFRVADVAMGSGHFLVAAIDRIERGLSQYLARRPMAVVRDELERLRSAARNALGESWAGDAIEDTLLLRRQIARRCIYGVDLNPLSVELARLSIWVHTFVPGLPLSFLDGNLVVGNSLVGIATLDEARGLLGGSDGDLFSMSADDLLGSAREPLQRLARLSEATAAEVKEARRLHEAARRSVSSVRDLFTVLAASRADEGIRAAIASGQVATRMTQQGDVFSAAIVRKAERALGGVLPVHFPVAFPEVFLRARSGFDVLLGNPPWERARTEDLEFWARHFPGLRGMATAARTRRVTELTAERPDLVEMLERERSEEAAIREFVRGFPGMNTGHPDYFRAFAWRFLQLACPGGGRIGIVLPGDAFKIKGAAPIRALLCSQLSTITVQLLTNKRGWVFDDVHPSKLIALVTGARGAGADGDAEFVLPPECHTLASWHATRGAAVMTQTATWLRSYSPSLVLPTLPSLAAMPILLRMMEAPRLGEHPDFPVARVYADFETSRDAERWHGARRRGDWPVYKGESFDLWTPDTGTYIGYTSNGPIREALQQRRVRSPRSSPYAMRTDEWRADPTTHPALQPRIAFRDTTNRTNRRTLIAALIPPLVVTTQAAPWILWLDDTDRPCREALLLGMLSSVITDWWMRRFAELHVDAEAFACLRIPRAERAPVVADRVRMAAARLAAVDDRYAHWATSNGVTAGLVMDAERERLLAEIDAGVAILHGLSRGDLTEVFTTFHEGWDYAARLALTSEAYDRLRSL
jgi:hypothetical protein